MSSAVDTNVVVSALLQPAGPPAAIIELAFGRQFRWYVSEPILTEYAAVLARNKLGVEPREAFHFF